MLRGVRSFGPGAAQRRPSREALERAITAADGHDPALPPPAAPRRFEIVRCLGVGGMGIVYEAIDLERGGRVALKRLRHTHAEWIYRFKCEFRCLEGLSHPNWVRPLELIEEAGSWYFTMELVEGVDFSTWVR